MLLSLGRFLARLFSPSGLVLHHDSVVGVAPFTAIPAGKMKRISFVTKDCIQGFFGKPTQKLQNGAPQPGLGGFHKVSKALLYVELPFSTPLGDPSTKSCHKYSPLFSPYPEMGSPRKLLSFLQLLFTL